MRSEQDMEVEHGTRQSRKQLLRVSSWKFAVLCFPSGHSAKRPVEVFKLNICDFSHRIIDLESTVSQLFDQGKLRTLCIHTCSQEKVKDVE